MSVTIKYLVSEKGQKASILVGGDGKAKQTRIVEPTQPEFQTAVEQGEVHSDGSITLNLCMWNYPQFDHVPTLAELLAVKPQLMLEEERKKEERRKEKHEETLCVLRERRTTSIDDNCRLSEDGINVYVSYTYLAPDWPYDACASVKESPEAQAWQAELDVLRLEALAKAEVEVRAKLLAVKEEAAKKAAEKAAREAAREEWFRSHNLEPNDIRLKVEDGALYSVPKGCWESHRRGKNWLAKIAVNPRGPGGLDRTFADKALGDAKYMLPDLSPGDAIEFGADYYSGGGRKSPTRWYGYMVALVPAQGTEPEYLVVHECGTGKQAIKEGAKFRGTAAPKDPVTEAIIRVNSEGAIIN